MEVATIAARCDRLQVLLGGAAKVDAAVSAHSGQRALAVGVLGIQVTADLGDPIPSTALGKAPLIRRARLATAGH